MDHTHTVDSVIDVKQEDEMTREILIVLLVFVSAFGTVLAVGSAIVGWVQR